MTMRRVLDWARWAVISALVGLPALLVALHAGVPLAAASAASAAAPRANLAQVLA
jgi:hypothetical protein